MKSYLYNQFVKVSIVRSLPSSCNKTFKSRITTTDSQKNFISQCPKKLSGEKFRNTYQFLINNKFNC